LGYFSSFDNCSEFSLAVFVFGRFTIMFFSQQLFSFTGNKI